MRALVPLDVIANDVCHSLGDTNFKHKFAIVRHLLDCYRDFSIYQDSGLSIRTEVLLYQNVINLPKDFIYETKVGVMCHGNIAVLTLDKNMRHESMNDTGCREYIEKCTTSDYGPLYTFYNAYRAGGYLGELYGRGRGIANRGTYNIDRKNGVLTVGSNIPRDSQIVIEYQSDGIADGLKLVPVEIKKMMEYYAKSEHYADKNITQSQVNRNYYEREYNRVKRLYNFRTALYMAEQINESFSPTNY